MNKKLIYSIVGIVLVIGFFGFTKVRTWFSVGRESLVDQIDAAIGEYRVKQTEVKTAISNLNGSMMKLMEGKIKSEVQAEQLDSQLVSLKEKKQAAQGSLGKLRDLIAKNEPAVLGGKSYSVVELQGMAEKVISAHKSLETQSKGIERARDILSNNAKTLGDRMSQGQATIANMQSQIEEIDAKILALSTMQDAAKTAGGDSASLAANFKDVQDQVNSLYAKVETNLRMEEESWKQASATGSSGAADIIMQTQDATDTLSKIDEVLGK